MVQNFFFGSGGGGGGGGGGPACFRPFGPHFCLKIKESPAPPGSAIVKWPAPLIVPYCYQEVSNRSPRHEEDLACHRLELVTRWVCLIYLPLKR